MNGFGVGSVLGFDIRIDYSWFVIFFLLLWSFTAGVFPSLYPEMAFGPHVLMGLSATLLFFASLLAHELSHAVVARSRGIPVDSITLFIFGGIARTRLEAERPRDEFAIAGVGPLASFVLAGLFLAAFQAAESAALYPAASVAQQLVYLNLLLAVFNLLPGFPLDGGRLFRALVWKATDDLTRATRWACRGGRALGWVLVLVGIIEAFAGFVVGGIWLAFIGWFLSSTARGAWERFRERGRRDGAPIVSLVRDGGHLVPASLTLQELVDWHVVRFHQDVYPVLQDGRVVGLVAVDDIRGTPREAWADTTIGSVMRPVRPSTPTDLALRRRVEPAEERFLRP